MKKVSGLALVQRLLNVLGWTVVFCLAGTAGAAAVTYDMTMSLGDDTFSLADLESAGLLYVNTSGTAPTTRPSGPSLRRGTGRSTPGLPPTTTRRSRASVLDVFEVTNLSDVTQIFSVSVIAPADVFQPVGGLSR